MKPDARDWHGVALAKLTNVMGEQAGHELAAAVLQDLGLQRIATASDLRLVAAALAAKGGFASAVGGLLGVHAAMYDPS